MSRLIREVFAVAMTFLFVTHQKGVSINNQECKVRPEIINIKSNEPLFYIFSVKINKCSGSCKIPMIHM